ncbi:hypothetical protein MB02_15470 [Croceicoccus estronivorus]|uniref:hypothetical protein n=1 Tax=Croceicoccus estronivorus TaxID=1172626 RepID=UPI000830A0F5|nr:hypothetical protein [Croceicoccus estronivorus]OCC22805.1 hypothetical protein MB02_15470 [Croceicoccus estronivorus]
MKILSKALVGTVAAGAMAVTSASPAFARDNDGIGAGEVIAGALIIGGIAAIAAAASDNDRDHYRDRYGYDGYSRYGYRDRDDYMRRGNPRQAVEMCVRTAERQASRYSYGRANVTDIRDIDRKSNGYTVKGRIAVSDKGSRWHSSRRGYDTGNFTCKVRYGRVVDLDFKNIRGL